MKGVIAGLIVATAVEIGAAVADEHHVAGPSGVSCPKGEIFEQNENRCVTDVPNTDANTGTPAAAAPAINGTQPDSGTVQYPNHGTGGPSDAPPK